MSGATACSEPALAFPRMEASEEANGGIGTARDTSQHRGQPRATSFVFAKRPRTLTHLSTYTQITVLHVILAVHVHRSTHACRGYMTEAPECSAL